MSVDGTCPEMMMDLGSAETDADALVFPTSYAQQRMWFFDQLNPGGALYVATRVVRLQGKLNIEALERAVNVVIARHEVLRTRFAVVDGEPVQVIVPDLIVRVGVTEVAMPHGHTGRIEDFEPLQRFIVDEGQRPFDLATGPLIRIRLVRLGAMDHVLLICLHHIIIDGWSLAIFDRELSAAYRASLSNVPCALGPLPIQYADYSEWQRDPRQQDVFDKELVYWRQQLHGELPVLELPTDHPRPPVQSFRGSRLDFALTPAETQAVKELSRRQGATLFMTLLGAFATLLQRYSGQDEILIGSPIANRSQPETEPLIGLFINTLVLRADLSDDPTFAVLLGRLREACLGAYGHQDVPFERLVDEFLATRDPARSPLVQVLFALQNPPKQELDLPDLRVSIVDFERWSARFDLELHFWEHPEHLSGAFVYSTDLFDEATLRQMVGHLRAILATVTLDASQPVSAISLLSDAERAELVRSPDSCARYDAFATIPARFAVQARRSPDAVAVRDSDQTLTYRSVDERSAQLARFLLELGIPAGAHVGIYLDCRAERAVAMLGVLKAGYVCALLDPNQPCELVRAHGERSRISVVLTRGDMGWPPLQVADNLPMVDLGLSAAAIGLQDATDPSTSISGSSPAAIVRALPGPVCIDHAAICHHVRWMQETLGLTPSDVLVHKSPASLDQALWEMLWPLLTGAVCAFGTAAGTGTALQRAIEGSGATVVFLVASELTELGASPPQVAGTLPRVRLAVCTGESPTDRVVERFMKNFSGDLVQLYGPPEAGGHVTVRRWSAESPSRWSFAGELTNKSVLVLDRKRQLVPAGVIGDVYVVGPGLAHGYVHSEVATASRFVPNPFEGVAGHGPKRPDRLFKTGERGRRLRDGRLEIVATPRGYTWRDGYQVALSTIESCLMNEPSVRDCVVLPRLSDDGGAEWVAYIVPGEPLTAERLRAQVASLLPAECVLCAFVPVTAIPLKAGRVDTEALSRFPVNDEALAAQCERLLAAKSGVRLAAVVLEEDVPEEPRLHLADMLPAGLAGASLAATTVAGSTAPEPEVPPSSDGVPSIRSGGPPVTLRVSTLGDALQRAAETAAGVIYIEDTGSEVRQTYAELQEDASRILRGLRQQGLKPGDRVIFQFNHNPAFLAGLWGCILGGFVPVPLAVPPSYETGTSAFNKLENAWHLLGKPHILCSRGLGGPLRELARRNGWGPSFHVHELEALRENPPDREWHRSDVDDVALLLLTSGSTGLPKVVTLRHRNILHQSAGSAEMNGFGPGDTSFNWMPLDHVGGVVMFHLQYVYVGCTQVHAPTALVLEQPLRWLDWIDRHRATITWAPNFAYGLINALGGQITPGRWDLSCLRFILNAGEAVVARVARRFLQLLMPLGLPPSAMHPAWGMSETSSAVIYSERFRLACTRDEDTFVEVGRPIPGCSVRIVDIQKGRIVAEGVAGRLQVKGCSVLSGYYENPELNREVFADDAWFETGDLGTIRDGQLTITGRAKDVIIVNGINYYSHEIEAVVEELDSVERSYTAACAVRESGDLTDRLVVFFHLRPGVHEAEGIREVRTQIARQVGINPDYLIPVRKDEIPKTEIGKIQRAQLVQRFRAGEFKDSLRRIDLLLGNANTLPAWFYGRTWREKAAMADLSPPSTVDVLVLLDRAGLGRLLCEELHERGHRCVTVERGSEFRRLSSAEYQLAPADRGGYAQLIAALRADGRRLDRIVHLWTYEQHPGPIGGARAFSAAQQEGLLSLLHLVKAIGQARGPGDRSTLHVVASHSQIVEPDDAFAAERTTAIGLVRSIPQELPWLRCQHIDLPMPAVPADIRTLARELERSPGDIEVAYRAGRRRVASLTRLEPASATASEPPFRERGLYVISGGLGGIGSELARELGTRYRARLLLLGRTQLPPQSEWASLVASTSEFGQRIATYERLRRDLGDDVMYAAADVRDLDAVRRALSAAETRWSTTLSGVLHLAGEFAQAGILDLEPDDVEAILAPKMEGAFVLHQLVSDRPGALFVSFSSVNGHLGGAMVAAYAAANRFLDGFAQDRRRSGLASYSLAWSMWDDVGMSRNHALKELAKARGYCLLGRNEGMTSLLIALQHSEPYVAIGLDPGKPWMQSEIAGSPRPVRKLVGYATASPDADRSWTPPAVVVMDRYGSSSTCEIVRLDRMPLTGQGEVDRARLRPSNLAARRTEDESIEPRDELERLIARAWCETLQVDRVGIDDNFFDLGGNSLRMTQVYGKLRGRVGRDIQVFELFQYPTVSSLAAFFSRGEKKALGSEGKRRAKVRQEAARQAPRRRRS